MGGITAATAQDRRGIRFWNLTSDTVVRLHLSPAGKNEWGPNQCDNDRDKEVEHRERLPITGVTPGLYDVQVGYEDGRLCIVRNIEIKAGAVFSIEDKDLRDCRRP
jgi:hypothetical protein